MPIISGGREGHANLDGLRRNQLFDGRKLRVLTVVDTFSRFPRRSKCGRASRRPTSWLCLNALRRDLTLSVGWPYATQIVFFLRRRKESFAYALASGLRQSGKWPQSPISSVGGDTCQSDREGAKADLRMHPAAFAQRKAQGATRGSQQRLTRCGSRPPGATR